MNDSDGEQESQDASKWRSSERRDSLIPSPSPQAWGEGSRVQEPEAPLPAHRERGWGEGVPPHDRLSNESELWRQAFPAIADKLREFGYDVEPIPDEAPSSLFVRRDLGDRAVVIAIDADGRFRAALTWVVGEWPSRDEIAGAPVRVVDAVSRAVTVTGQMDEPEQVAGVIAGLGAIASWASVAGSEPPPTAT